MNKLAKITDMIFSLDGLDNTDNLEDGISSNTLFTYIPDSEQLTSLNQQPPYIRNSKMVILFS